MCCLQGSSVGKAAACFRRTSTNMYAYTRRYNVRHTQEGQQQLGHRICQHTINTGQRAVCCVVCACLQHRGAAWVCLQLAPRFMAGTATTTTMLPVGGCNTQALLHATVNHQQSTDHGMHGNNKRVARDVCVICTHAQTHIVFSLHQLDFQQ